MKVKEKLTIKEMTKLAELLVERDFLPVDEIRIGTDFNKYLFLFYKGDRIQQIDYYDYNKYCLHCGKVKEQLKRFLGEYHEPTNH